GMEWLDGWIDRRPSADPAWVNASAESDYRLRMTPRELRDLIDELHAVIQRHDQAAEDSRAASPAATGDAGEPEARAVRVLLYAFPAEDGA
ncbi:MAG: hypothetical protein ACRDIL_22105, partial [Candidatus Limnocylindrales bacterium]